MLFSHRMIAFRAALDQAGQAQLQEVMINRVKKFATKIAEYHSLSHHDKDQILSHNVPLVVILSTCSMFSTKMPWTTQLTPILGAEEVEKLKKELCKVRHELADVKDKLDDALREIVALKAEREEKEALEKTFALIKHSKQSFFMPCLHWLFGPSNKRIETILKKKPVN